jgi:hypothetical protein
MRLSDFRSAQGAYDCFGVLFEDSQESFGGSSRPPAALLPVLEGILADPDHVRELRLRDIDRLSELADIDGIILEDPGRFQLASSNPAGFFNALAEVFE